MLADSSGELLKCLHIATANELRCPGLNDRGECVCTLLHPLCNFLQVFRNTRHLLCMRSCDDPVLPGIIVILLQDALQPEVHPPSPKCAQKGEFDLVGVNDRLLRLVVSASNERSWFIGDGGIKEFAQALNHWIVVVRLVRRAYLTWLYPCHVLLHALPVQIPAAGKRLPTPSVREPWLVKSAGFDAPGTLVLTVPAIRGDLPPAPRAEERSSRAQRVDWGGRPGPESGGAK
jgi:hypothetical protein